MKDAPRQPFSFSERIRDRLDGENRGGLTKAFELCFASNIPGGILESQCQLLICFGSVLQVKLLYYLIKMCLV